MKYQINKYYNENKNLCLNCIRGHKTDKGFIFCQKTKKAPEYNFYCSDFQAFKKSKLATKNLFKQAAREKRKKEESEFYYIVYILTEILKLFGVFFFVIFVIPLILVSFMMFLSSIYEPLLFLVFLLPVGFGIGWNIYKKQQANFYKLFLPSPFVGAYIHVPYYYLVLSVYAYNKKTNASAYDLKIIEHAIIRVFGLKYRVLAKDFLENGIEGELFDKKFKKYAVKLKYDYRLLLFWLICEMYVYENLTDFIKSETIKEIANILDLKPIDYTGIKKELELQEQARIKKIENEILAAEAEKRRQEEQRRRASQIFSIKRTNYYSVLGLTSKATDDEIKKRVRELALKYHPDRFVNDIEGQQKAVEEFKKITEAYNYIRDERGI